MVVRARLIPPPPQDGKWSWNEIMWHAIPVSVLTYGERRLEAENYLSNGYGIRLILEKIPNCVPLKRIAKTWSPNRLKGIQVGPNSGMTFLAATQVFDTNISPRKWLSLEKTPKVSDRIVKKNIILVTCSGTVGRAIISYLPHLNKIISHDLIRVEPKDDNLLGWIYALLKTKQVRLMMSASQYGHVIKHLECSHLNEIPLPIADSDIQYNFNTRVKEIFLNRDKAYLLINEAEHLFSDAIGPIQEECGREEAFNVSVSEIIHGRRRLEAYYHNPRVKTILKKFNELRRPIQLLSEVTEKVWWPHRFKRIPGKEGLPYWSADELFSVNPHVTKRVMVGQVQNIKDFYVKKGWILMACSGQIYGLNGSVMIATKTHENVFLSDDLIRILPYHNAIRLGYLFAVLNHPTFGVPLIKRYGYGTSIQHIDPVDVGKFPVIRLGEEIEKEIADKMEKAADLREAADEFEKKVIADAEEYLSNILRK